ncbi:MAG: hypothetical protein ACMXX9_03025 [Candidatus Woesearchaeota archaeon]
MGQDIYTKIQNLKEEYASNGINLKPKNVGEILVFSSLNVPKYKTLSHSKNFDNGYEDTYDELTVQASRLLKGKHIQEIRSNIVGLDTSSIYKLDKLKIDIKEILHDFEESHPQSIEHVIYNSLVNKKEDISWLGNKMLLGSKAYSRIAKSEAQKGRNWKLFLEYNNIYRALLK